MHLTTMTTCPRPRPSPRSEHCTYVSHCLLLHFYTRPRKKAIIWVKRHVQLLTKFWQANRAKVAKANYDFSEGSQLPPTIPAKYNEKLTNRIFKRRVIDMICNCIMQHVSHLPLQKEDAKLFTRKLILDYSGCPIQFTCPADGSLDFDKQPVFLTDLPPLGEADIKYLRWAHVFQGDLVAYSVDGDFIPIALIHHELAIASGDPSPPYKVALYRMQYNCPSSSAAAKSKASSHDKQQARLAGKKRKKGGGQVVDELVLAPAAASAAESNTKSTSKRREYEYVDIPALYAKLSNVLLEQCPPSKFALAYVLSKHFMRMLALLIGLSGTDFSRNLPHLSPMTLWTMLLKDERIFSAWMRTYDTSKNAARPEEACDLLAASIYVNKFSTHFAGGGKNEGLRHVLRQLQQSGRLAERTKKQLPSFERVETTFRNINWLLQYWLCRPPQQLQDEGRSSWDHSACYPDPISPEFGFKLVATAAAESGGKKGKKASAKGAATKVTWLDDDESDSNQLDD